MAASSVAIAAPPKPKPFNKPKPGLVGSPGNAGAFARRLSGRRPNLETDSILARQLAAEAPRKKGPVSAFRGAKVEMSKAAYVKIPDLVGDAFVQQAAMSKKLNKLKGSGIFGSVRTSTEVYEFKDSYILVRSTGATVADVKVVKAKAPVFSRLSDGKKHKVRQGKLTAGSRAGLAKFKTEVAGYPAAHPLRKAMAKGDQALLDALASGVGDVEIVDTLQIPKKAPKITAAGLQVPKVVGERIDYGRRRTLPGTRPGGAGLTVTNSGAAADLVETVENSAAGVSDGGGYQQTAEFIAGNTWAENWRWQRRWNVPSGFLRVTFGAAYAVGLRIPIEVKTEMTPAWVCDDGLTREQRVARFRLKVKAEAKDGDAAFYRRAGMPRDKIAKGKELALQASVGYGIKLRLLWETLVDRPYHEAGVDWGANFDPPQGTATQRVTDVFLPARTTNTAFAVGPLRGSVQMGLRIDVSGKVRTRVSALQEGRRLVAAQRPSTSAAITGHAKSTPQRLTLSNTGWKTYSFELRNQPNLGSGPVPNYEKSFGFRIDEVGYKSRWSVVPGVKVDARASYAGYGVRGVWTFWVEAARIPIGSIMLGHHPGTRVKQENLRGKKVWHRDTPGDPNWCADHNDTV